MATAKKFINSRTGQIFLTLRKKQLTQIEKDILKNKGNVEIKIKNGKRR